MNTNKTKLPSLISIMILTLITIVMWVGLDVYRAFQKPVEITVPDEISKSINPNLDANSIKQLESRIFLNDSQIPDNIIVSSKSGAISK